MLIIFIPAVILTMEIEQKGNPALSPLHVDQQHKDSIFDGGNMEGKEIRLGIANSAIWAVATTATANGSTSSSLSSFTPLGGLVSLWMIQLGEVVFGGVGSGLYSMLVLLIITVFVIGLMVGRTPEYLGKKIEIFEIQMASFTVLIIPLIILILTAFGLMINLDSLKHADSRGPHALTSVLYAFSSMANNNGSSFPELDSNTFFYNTTGGIAMLIGRYLVAIPIMAIAGSLAKKKTLPSNLSTLPTHTPLFVILLVSIVILINALTFLPVLALGPIVEQIMLWDQYGN
jgi:K+-transporting ATPase ATPase A chain